MNLAVWNSVHISNSPLSRSGTHFWKSLPFNMQAISTPSLQTLPVISNSEFFVSLCVWAEIAGISRVECTQSH